MQQAEIVRHGQLATELMPTGAIQQHDGMSTGRDVPTDLGQMQVHRLGIGLGQDKSGAEGTRGTHRAEDVGPVVALIAWC